MIIFLRYKEKEYQEGVVFYKGYKKEQVLEESELKKDLLEDLDILGFGKTKFVMDRGFYSEGIRII